MPTEILMPALSPTMEEGTLAKWLVQEGDSVASGDLLAEIETDKANMDIEALGGGVVLKILVQEGETVPVGALIGIIGEEGEDISSLLAEAEAAASGTPVEAEPVESLSHLGPRRVGRRLGELPVGRPKSSAQLVLVAKGRGEEWGEEGVRDFVFAFRNMIGNNVERPLMRVFGMDVYEFDGAFRAWLRAKYASYAERQTQREFGRRFPGQ